MIFSPLHRAITELQHIDMRLFFATVFMSALSVSQSWADQPLDQLLACRQMADPTTRLECFDRASDVALTATKPDNTPQSSKRAIVESNIARISKPVTGRVNFTLENGQVWRQMDAESAKSAKVGDRVGVSKTFLGAYWLKIEGGQKWRVTLLQ